MTAVIEGAMTRDKEVDMKSIVKRAGMLAAAFIVGVGGSARAATLEVKVPFPFVVNGKTLPAGEYRVESDHEVVTFVGEKGTKATAVVLTTPAAGHDPAGDQPALSFTHDETQYRLVDVWASGSQGLAVGH
jgi:hypothetical protein